MPQIFLLQFSKTQSYGWELQNSTWFKSQGKVKKYLFIMILYHATFIALYFSDVQTIFIMYRY